MPFVVLFSAVSTGADGPLAAEVPGQDKFPWRDIPAS